MQLLLLLQLGAPRGLLWLLHEGVSKAGRAAQGGRTLDGAVSSLALRTALLARRIARARLASSAAEPECGGAQTSAPVAVTFLTLARMRAATRRHRLRMVVLSVSAGVRRMVSMAWSTSSSSGLGLP